MSSALFLVQTPLHVQNACEAIPVFGITQSVFFIVHSKNNEKWLAQINELLPENVNTLLCERDDHDIEGCIKEYSERISHLKTYDFDFVFLGDARLYIFVDCVNALANKNTFLMDDGALTITTMHSLKTHGVYYPLGKSTNIERTEQIEKVKRKYGLWDMKHTPYNLFTIFDFPSSQAIRVVKNPLQSIRYTHTNTDPQSVLFLGQPLGNGRFCSNDMYNRLMERIVNYYSDKRFLYLPHPRETEEQVAQLKGFQNLCVIETSMPVEHFVMTLDSVPHTISGFFSTALWNIAKFQTGLHVEAFRIDSSNYDDAVLQRKSRNGFLSDFDANELCYEHFALRLKVIEGIV